MALILEVLHPDGARTRHVLNGQALTLGRGLANDVVLDDPYVDASHARVILDESGAVVVEDLGSVNGLVSGTDRIFGRAVVRPGATLRVGRTQLRFRDPSESLPPALVDVQVPSLAAPSSSRVTRLMSSTPANLGVAALALFVYALAAWLTSSGRSSANDVITKSLAFATFAAAWAGLWSIASRIIVHQFRFVRHLAVVSAIVLGGLLYGYLNGLLEFLYPDATFIDVMGIVAMIGCVVLLVAGHLALTSAMPRRRRWKIAGIAAATVMGIAALAALSKDDSFSDVPKYPSTLLPVAAGLVPTKSIDQFESVAGELKKEADQLAR
ncbi:MAG TPA: FHA domain-containing protein [Gemmatimonadaceae bacterium]|nr:FHA domain-containing protein [Gemmatimonadaceae bacterium]